MTIVDQLIATKEATTPYFDLPLPELSKSYAPGKWTVQYLLHHMADAESVLFERIRRTIAKPNQVIWGFDQDAWANQLDYSNRSLANSKVLFTAVRIGVIELAEKYYHTHGHHQYVHSETGIRTLKDEFDKVVWHNEGHLKQIREAIGG